MSRRRALLVALTVALVPFRPSFAKKVITVLPVDVQQVKVSSYVEGAKIKVALEGQRVEFSFFGADTLEPGECYVEEAKDRMKALLPNGTVLYLERGEDVTEGKDRLVRHVRAEDDGGAYLVNAKLIRDGNAGWKARDAEDGHAKYADRYERAESDANARGNGLWSECDRLHSQARTRPVQTAGVERARRWYWRNRVAKIGRSGGVRPDSR